MEFEDEKMENKIKMESYLVGLSPYKIKYQMYFENSELVSMSDQSNKDKLKIELP